MRLDDWEPRLVELAHDVRVAARATMRAAIDANALETVDRPVADGAGDVTFGLDVPTEVVLTHWLEAHARHAPLSLLTEDAGWRHRGPDPRAPGAASIELEGFDHGGPRIVVDPIDGTRNLMADLRSAWTAIALCPPGAGEPRLADVTLAVCGELPDTRAARYRTLLAHKGRGTRLEERALEEDRVFAELELHADHDARPDHGYFSIFSYSPAMRPRIGALAARFFERLERYEHADLRACFDDQYISNCGQLFLLARGTYRLIADVRAHLWRPELGPRITSKPYDCAAGILAAREAGCIVTDAEGGPLDFPLDATTPVSFVGWANAATAARLGPHWRAALAD